MKQLRSMTILTALLLTVTPSLGARGLATPVRDPGAPAVQASKPCSTWSLPDLRGTYAFTGTAWQDLSEINPALPAGYAPVSIIGAFKVNGNGELSGWALINAGGVPMTAEFVNSQFGTPKADCSFPISLSMKMNGEIVTGPYTYGGLIAGGGTALEVAFMMVGAGPGSHVELDRAKRISMNVK